MPSFAAGFHLKSTAALATLLLTIALISPHAALARGQALLQRGDADGGTSRHFEEMPLDIEFSPSIGYHLLTNRELYDTYRGLFIFDIEGSVGIGERTRFFLSAGYGSSSGNPYFDLPEFESEDTSDLLQIPMQVGFRANISPQPRMHVYLGASLVVAWVRERVPAGIAGGEIQTRDNDGIGQGMRLLINPQWRSGLGKYSAGLEISFGWMFAELNSEPYGSNTDFGDVSLRLKLGRRL